VAWPAIDTIPGDNLMNWQSTRRSLKHLGTLHGRGDLLIEDGGQKLGTVEYEIDGYLRRDLRSDNGQIQGEADILGQAFRAGAACIVMADGQCVDVVVADPHGSSAAEITVSGRFPSFGATETE
jgi:hypothetical protein